MLLRQDIFNRFGASKQIGLYKQPVCQECKRMNLGKVLVDPGNGEILSRTQISKEEHMMMHRMEKQGMIDPGMMMGH